MHITHHHHHHNSDGDGDDSDGTSFTDDEADEAHQMALDEQAEEDRLIRNGGAGIPVGPVRDYPYVSKLCLTYRVTRTVHPNRYFPQ